MRFKFILLSCIGCFSWTVLLALTGKIISVSDGDTFTILTEANNKIKIRLHGIDCPEKGQAFGNKAKQFTADLVFGKTVTVDEKDIH